MIVAAVRQVADWLVDGTRGVNQQIALVPGDSSDALPALVTVWDATRFEWVARGHVLRERTGAGPLLLVRGPDVAELPLFAGDGGGWAAVEVRVAYVLRQSSESWTDFALRDAYQTLRAAARSIGQQFQTMQASPERARVAFDRPTARFEAAQETLSGEETILASLLVTLPALDEWALGA